ncbi:hypothetical protein JCM33774_75150 [Actinophytocola sp. KF-1]
MLKVASRPTSPGDASSAVTAIRGIATYVTDVPKRLTAAAVKRSRKSLFTAKSLVGPRSAAD